MVQILACQKHIFTVCTSLVLRAITSKKFKLFYCNQQALVWFYESDFTKQLIPEKFICGQ